MSEREMQIAEMMDALERIEKRLCPTIWKRLWSVGWKSVWLFYIVAAALEVAK